MLLISQSDHFVSLHFFFVYIWSHISQKTWDVLLWDWLTSLSISASSYIHYVAKDRISFSVWLSSIPLCIYRIFGIQLPIHWLYHPMFWLQELHKGLGLGGPRTSVFRDTERWETRARLGLYFCGPAPFLSISPAPTPHFSCEFPCSQCLLLIDSYYFGSLSNFSSFIWAWIPHLESHCVVDSGTLPPSTNGLIPGSIWRIQGKHIKVIQNLFQSKEKLHMQ